MTQAMLLISISICLALSTNHLVDFSLLKEGLQVVEVSSQEACADCGSKAPNSSHLMYLGNR